MLRILIFLSCVCLRSSLTNARSVEEPTRFTLNNVQNETKNALPSRLEQMQELLGGVADAIRIGRGRFVNSITLARNIVLDLAEQIAGGAQSNVDNPIIEANRFNQTRRAVPFAQSTMPAISISETQDRVHLTNKSDQGILERPKPDNIRQILDSLLRPTPIVDGIKEDQKYGNMGDRFTEVTRTFINGYENFSNFLNSIIDLPIDAVKRTSKKITETLNEIGAWIIGLS